MKALKIILYAVLFFAIGEALVRIDRRFDLLNNAPEKITVEIEESDLLKSVQQGRFVKDSSQFRILVIGDSYIHGGGIDPAKKFSKKLAAILNTDSPSCDFVVLDVSVPRNNTLDNYNAFEYFDEAFDPHLIFWAYNYNDVLGKLKNDEEASTDQQEVTQPPGQIKRKRTGLNKIIKDVYSLSRLALYLSETAQKELKTLGIVTPGGDFANLTQKVYLPSSENWQETQRIFKEVSAICRSDKKDFVFYKMPEFNLMHKPELFSMPDNALLYFTDSIDNMVYINGSLEFADLDIDQYKMSKYDGHPNAKAHLFIANRIAEYIKGQSRLNCSND
ncbi:MAG: hypothetical protein Roseis2KO_27000 [Roseivirga sp.]